MFLPEHPPLLLQRWIFQRQRRPWLNSFGNQNFVAAFPADFHVHFPVFRTLLCVHNGAPRFSKQRSRRNHNSVRHSRHSNAHLGAHSRRHPRIQLGQAELHGKVSRNRPPRGEIHARRRTNRFYFPFKTSIRQGVKQQLGCLSHAQLAPLCFFYARGNLQRCGVRQLQQSRTRPRPVSRLERRWPGLRFPMILQRHHAVQRRTQRQQRQTLLIQLHLIRGLIVFLPLADHIGPGRSTVRLQLCFRLFLLLFRIRQLQLRLLTFNHQKNFLLAGIQLRFFGIELRFHHIRQILLFFQFRRRSRLRNLRLRRRQRRFVLRKFRFDGRRVKFHQHIAFFHFRRIGNNVQYLQVARAERRCNNQRPLRLYFTFYFQIFHKLFPFRFSRWHARLRTRQPESAEHKHANHRRGRDDCRPRIPSPFSISYSHGFSAALFASSSLRRTTSPSASPDTITPSKSFVRPTFTSRLSNELPPFTHAKHFFSSHATLCRGTTNSLLALPKSRSSAADKSGNNRASCPCTTNCIANVRTNSLNCPLCPSGESCSSVAGNASPGYASRCISAFCPRWTLRKSTWFTSTRTSICDGSTTCKNGTPGLT